MESEICSSIPKKYRNAETPSDQQGATKPTRQTTDSNRPSWLCDALTQCSSDPVEVVPQPSFRSRSEVLDAKLPFNALGSISRTYGSDLCVSTSQRTETADESAPRMAGTGASAVDESIHSATGSGSAGVPSSLQADASGKVAVSPQVPAPGTPATALDDESDGSDCSSDSSDSETEALHFKLENKKLTLLERRRVNIQRHTMIREALGLEEKREHESNSPEGSEDGEETRTLVENELSSTLLHQLPLNDNYEQQLSVKYPFRQKQIRLLKAALQIPQLEHEVEEVYVPPPVFVWGPSGSGKTSITRDVIDSLCSHCTGAAYINCATLEPSSIEALVESAYYQIAKTFKTVATGKNKRKRKRKTEKFPKSPLHEATSQEDEYNDASEEATEDRIELARARLSQDIATDQSTLVQQSSLMNDDTTGVPSNNRTRYSRHSKVEETKPVKRMALKKEMNVKGKGYSSHGVPLALGRSLAPFLGIHGTGCAFLVLDHAERLMTLTQSQARCKSNYLAQLLLLPKVLELRLSVVVISSSTLLMNTRIDNAMPVQKSIGTLDDGIHPIRIHFPAYSGNETFKAILKTPENLSSLIGKGYDSDFHHLLVSSFLSALVQATSGLSRDINDLLAAGRRLWVAYIRPLHPSNIEETMKLINGDSGDTQKAVLSYLNQRMVNLSKNIERSIVGHSTETTASSLPYLSKYLVLASFICQHNKATKDKQLFTSAANGKKRKHRHQQQDDGDPETAAFATWDQQRLRILRPRSFPLERMLSIFVNIVGLHDNKELGATSVSDRLSLLGNSVFLESLGQLRAQGLLREMPSDEGIALSDAMYCCDLGRNDVDDLARSIGFPLDRYLQ